MVVTEIEQGSARRNGFSLFPGKELLLFEARSFEPDDYQERDCYLIFCEDRAFNGTVEDIMSGKFGASIAGQVFTYSPALDVIAFRVVGDDEYKKTSYSVCDIRFK